MPKLIITEKPSVAQSIAKVLSARKRCNGYLEGKWELISRNPVEHATLPKEEKTERNIWTAETLFKALDVYEDDILSLVLNLAFSCSLRMGEMLGLTWDCIDNPGQA